jgi:spoIIIJ-associated protein
MSPHSWPGPFRAGRPGGQGDRPLAGARQPDQRQARADPRRGGEGLQALQHIVATAFRKQLGDDNRIVIDCNGFRKDKDAELRQMARFIAEKARSSGIPQEMGPLNPYERRIVHLAIAEDPTVTSESIGDAFLKTVIISTKR